VKLGSFVVLGLVLALGLELSAHADPSAGFELHVPERVELRAGESGTLSLSISIDRGRAISKDANLILDLAPDGALSVKRRRLGRGDAVDPDADEPRFAIPLRAGSPGDFAIKLHLRFWLCGGKVCRPIDARRTIVVAVAVAPAPDAAPRQGSADH
jgi:hypothetical protein